MEEKVQGIRNISGLQNRQRLRIIEEMRSQRTYIYDPWA